MNNLFKQIQDETKEFLSHKSLKFYKDYAPELSHARETFFDHPLILRCREDVLPFLHDEYGHGIEHSKNVSIEAAAIILRETHNEDFRLARHMVILVQFAGLLHDICRMEPNHAEEGAHLAFKILKDFPLSDEDKEIISFAIKNHEAFKTNQEAPDYVTEIVSSALYDADKFRWGPDNFVTTLWEICDYHEWSLSKIVERFPYGLEIIQYIADTFRTQTGKLYGPEFIEVGLEVGNYIYRRLSQLSK